MAQGVIIGVLSFGATAGVMAARAHDTNRHSEAYNRLAAVRKPGSQLMLVYIGSARCGWCKNPALPSYLATIRDSLAVRAVRQKRQLITLGIAVDVVKHEGIDHLNRVADFDQIAAGGSWLNEVMIDYVWSRWGAPSATPQLMVFSRLVVREASSEAVTYRVENQQLLARKVGLYDIEAWVREGVPTPRLINEVTAVPAPPSR